MKDTYFDWDNVPLILTADSLAMLLQISRSSAYSLCHTSGFPVSHIGGRMVVEKNNLRRWLAQNTESCSRSI